MIGNSFYKYSRKYIGPLKAAILDWSGTTVDKYVIAPAIVFVEVFKKAGVPITMMEARDPMGLRKDLHIAALCKNEEIKKRWKEIKGKYPDQSDVDAMFKDFVPAQLQCLPEYATLLPGTKETVDKLRKDLKMKFGCTTGFTRCMVDVLVSHTEKQGFQLDCTVAGDDVQNGARPKPFMVYKNLDLMDIHPIQSVVKVDDTISGVGEALEAGCWGVGVAKYSNYMNINSEEEERKLTASELLTKIEKSRELLRKTGVHYVIDSIIELPEVIDDINKRLANGEQP